MKRFFLVIWALVLVVSGLNAQSRSSATFGLDPSDDDALEKIRSRSDSIRRHRPVIALVLSGGGAKGAAQIGTLKMLEDYDIPVDMIVGTSVGGLLGGFYALGYPASFLDSLVRSIDWGLALSDDIPREYISYQKKEYDSKFAFSMPFTFRKKNIEVRPLAGQSLVGGLNVSYIISSLSSGYADSTDFFKLPIPFVCVATDMVSCKAKVWHSGSINEALRSTMAIPGVFAPVRTGGMVLVDGGMRNNFPADIAKDMGADVVIGVNLSSTMDATDESTLRNFGDIAMRGIDMFGSDSYERNVKLVDIHVRPDVTPYHMLSFSPDNIDTLLVRGYRAADAHAYEFAMLKSRCGDAGHTLQGTPAVDINETPVVIGDVSVTGVSPEEAETIKSRIYPKPGKIVSRREAENAVASIFGRGGYNMVSYDMLGSGEPYTFHLNCVKGPKNRLGVGLRADSEELVSLLFNVGFNTTSPHGSALDLTGKIGSNPYFDFHYILNIPALPTLNFRAFVRWTDRNRFYYGGNRFNINYLTFSQELYLSNIAWSEFDMKLGIRNDLYKINSLLTDDIVASYDRSAAKMDYPSIFLEGTADSTDDSYFPTEGIFGRIRADFITKALEENPSSAFLGVASASGAMPLSVGRFTVTPSGYLRLVWGSSTTPLPFANVIGGYMGGRYVDHQIPFIGIANAAYRRDNIAVARMDFRLRIFKNSYLTATYNFCRDFDSFYEFEYGESIHGAGIGYAYATVAGPFTANVFWSSLTGKVGVYFSFGFDF